MRAGSGERGSALAESAVAALCLFTLLFGAAEFARAYNIYESLTNAAREGARFAIAPDPASGALPVTGDIQAHVDPFLTPLGITGTVTVVTTSHVVNAATNTYTQVAISAPYSFFFLPFGTITLSATSEMRNETN
jgi:Flp pilus assembly protein TadG